MVEKLDLPAIPFQLLREEFLDKMIQCVAQHYLVES